ncbi:MAG: hypothetical protein RMK18_10785 [Armatimonadota bacterium]|nr:hypothetical protein [Armatimonadota bacterium]MCX7776693.1 hypothetical protein [Armatimonadota bacterium]MDW8026331.1 hypothetical protein [Armatimonadota bacterium]
MQIGSPTEGVGRRVRWREYGATFLKTDLSASTSLLVTPDNGFNDSMLHLPEAISEAASKGSSIT